MCAYLQPADDLLQWQRALRASDEGGGGKPEHFVQVWLLQAIEAYMSHDAPQTRRGGMGGWREREKKKEGKRWDTKTCRDRRQGVKTCMEQLVKVDSAESSDLNMQEDKIGATEVLNDQACVQNREIEMRNSVDNLNQSTVWQI